MSPTESGCQVHHYAAQDKKIMTGRKGQKPKLASAALLLQGVPDKSRLRMVGPKTKAASNPTIHIYHFVFFILVFSKLLSTSLKLHLANILHASQY